VAESNGLGGPKDLASSEKAIRGVADYFESRNSYCDFHPVPDLAAAQHVLFNELRERGFGIGMHFHSESWRDGSYRDALGLYPEEVQRRILTEAMDDYAQALGFRPVSYSAGNFSMSPDTYRILSDLGIRQTSCCLPERYIPKWGANWIGTFPFARWAHAESHLLPGELDLMEFPIACHPVRYVADGNPMDIRLDCSRSPERKTGNDLVVEETYYEEMVRINFSRVWNAAWPIKSLAAFSHNYFDFSDPDLDQRKNLESLIDAAHHEADRHDCPLTIESLEKTRRRIESVRHPVATV